MKYILTIITFLISSLYLQISGQSLEESLVIAAENNPLLKAKYNEFEMAMQKVTQVNSLPDPILSFGYFINPVETRIGPQQAKLGISQMFPWFGTLTLAGDVYTLQAEAKYQEFINVKNELFLKVKLAWYPIYEVRKKIALEKENQNILYTYKQLATIGFKNNKNTMVDVIRVDIMIENSITKIKLLQKEIYPLNVHFNKLLNQSDSITIQTSETITLISIPENYRKDSLLVNHPLLVSLDLKMKAAQQTEELSKKQGLPTFGVGIDYVFVGERSDMNVDNNGRDIIMPMLSMSIPLYRKKYDAHTKETQLKQKAIANYKANTENSLLSKYEMAWYELEKAKTLISLYKTQVVKTQKVISLLETAYSNSGQEFEEVLRFQQELLQYQIAETTAIKSFYIALAKLDYLTSK